jgi:glucokinase
MLHLAETLLSGRAPAAVGVSFGGPLDFHSGTVLRCFQVPGWENFPLKDHLRAALNAPAIVENDANAAAFGEWAHGAGLGCKSLFYITVSTGIGGGWVLDGRIFRGANGLAGEIGHLAVKPDGPLCTCGKRGCLEALASGPAIACIVSQRLLAEPVSESLLLSLAGLNHPGVKLTNSDPPVSNPPMITAEQVALAAEAGDRLAREVLDDAARYLGQAIAAVILLLNPERVVLGGGVAKSGEYFWRALRQAASALVLPGMAVEILPAFLGDDAPLWGAAALAQSLIP